MKSWVTVLLFSITALAQSTNKPTIRPYFDRIDDGPAFMLECSNTSGLTVSSSDPRWPTMGSNTVRIDGKMPDFGSTDGPRLSREVKAGETWRGVFALRQSWKNFFPAVKNGALKRVAVSHTITPGQHTLAVQCFGLWSDELTFYWEPDTQKE